MNKIKPEDYIDKKSLENKLGIKIDAIIKAWKNGKKDAEISSTLGIEEWKLNYLRSELQHLHYKARVEKRKEEKNFLN